MHYSNKKETSSHYLLGLIHHERALLLKTIEKFGLNSEKTLEASQELDALIVDYQRMTKPASKENIYDFRSFR
ncbi:aspartyl-phosphate phosphatase Spo0E family protein [Virgibacillus halodenitrificans]|uniref:aspartyl-phosphate phosphatase Spo0E family protein n=1 Tax=Virgibacillus halodenitrificans TaxID=1482 RepID=UPI000EF50521|nr:aspartyl-phosphate phosphatase Spo0E family protein [Virgibacillus halodenitrificans]